ncbi:apoptosis inhibitor 5 [Diorhabda carinulata]|uniref:apoptosis inhibitor 5 n=1 Tax=Diorhabda carinulata TaxID=1163345 RepID=UPI0025A01A3F|nr:apoptosis inhibitor 5 [Diorhabda carinulata]
MTDKIDELYKKYDILTDAKDNIAKYSDVYLECIEGTKGTEKEKKLAAQIISQFFKHFPDHQKQAVEAVLDLCEDSDLSIRINAIKVLPIFCKDVKEHVSRVADILCQLITLLDDQDLNIACNSLIQVYKESPTKTVKAIFNYIFTSVENSREKCVHFLYKKLVKVDDKMAPEINDLLVEEGKKILQDSTAAEFLTIMSFLSQSKLTKTTAGQQELVNAIADRAEIHKDFDLNDTENLHCERIIMCTQYALPLFNANVESTNFVKFYCEQILEKWDNIGTLKDGECLQYQILKQLAELSAHCGKLETPSTCIVQIFDKLKRFMPLPPEDGDIDKIPNLDFTSVECLLYAFHRLARQSPDFLTADPAVLKDFRSRLNYFSRGVGGCKRSLEKISNKDDEKIKIAPTVLDNINALIKDLFYTTPIYKCNVQLSFKLLDKVKTSEKSQTPQKRHVPIHFDSSNGSATKQIRSNKGSDNVKLYTPPSGKFSNNFQSYDRSGGRSRGRAGRGMRGMRGSPRGWRN